MIGAYIFVSILIVVLCLNCLTLAAVSKTAKALSEALKSNPATQLFGDFFAGNQKTVQ